MSYGFRPRRSASGRSAQGKSASGRRAQGRRAQGKSAQGKTVKDVLREVDRLIKEGYNYLLDADIQTYFDSIPLENLLDRLKEVLAPGLVLDLLERWLKQDIMTKAARWTRASGPP
jgi:retron-type reverse transcriptase